MTKRRAVATMMLLAFGSLVSGCTPTATPEEVVHRIGAVPDPALAGRWVSVASHRPDFVKAEMVLDGDAGRFVWREFGDDPTNPGYGDYEVVGAYGVLDGTLHLVGDVLTVADETDHRDDVSVERSELTRLAYSIRRDGDELSLGGYVAIGATDGVVGRWSTVHRKDYVDADATVLDGYGVQRVLDVGGDGSLLAQDVVFYSGKAEITGLGGTYELVGPGTITATLEDTQVLYLGTFDPNGATYARIHE